MNWVKSFYELQYQMLENPSDYSYQQGRIDTLKKHKIKPGFKLLELGGGFGAFTKLAINKGYHVTMIELVAFACEKAKSLFENSTKNLEIICGDFYTIKYRQKFEAVCYWDGFGIGKDEDQIQLLHLIYRSLKKDGLFFVDVYNPLYWSRFEKFKLALANGEREYSYQHQENLMIDCWTDQQTKQKACQYLKCYSPENFEQLILNIGFEIIDLIPSGYVDYENKTWHETTEVSKSLSYTFVLKK